MKTGMIIVHYNDLGSITSLINNIKDYNTIDKVVIVDNNSNISNKINGEDLFIMAYEVCDRFKLSYKENKIHIILEIVNLNKHFLVYIIDLLTRLINKIDFK